MPECTHPKATWKNEMLQTAHGIFNVGECDYCHAEVEQAFGPTPIRLRTVSARSLVKAPGLKVYMFATSRKPIRIEARLYSEKGNGTYFSGEGSTDAEAIGSLVCRCREKFNIEEFVLDCEGPTEMENT
jgi:hypothetical protein